MLMSCLPPFVVPSTLCRRTWTYGRRRSVCDRMKHTKWRHQRYRGEKREEKHHRSRGRLFVQGAYMLLSILVIEVQDLLLTHSQNYKRKSLETASLILLLFNCHGARHTFHLRRSMVEGPHFGKSTSKCEMLLWYLYMHDIHLSVLLFCHIPPPLSHSSRRRCSSWCTEEPKGKLWE